MPELLKRDDTYDFLLAFVKELRSLRNEPEGATTYSESLDSVIYDLLDAAIKQSNPTRYYPRRNGITTKRVQGLVQYILLEDWPKALERLFTHLIEDDKTLRLNLKEIFTPVVPDLIRMSDEKTNEIGGDILKVFLRWLIESVLHVQLGKKTSNVDPTSIRKIGCNGTCRDCRELDSFIRSERLVREFRKLQSGSTHLKSRLKTAPDIVSYYGDVYRGSGYVLEVHKRKEVVDAIAWDRKQRETREFLACFEAENVMERIMGERLDDVRKALSGEKDYEPGTYTLHKAPALGIKLAKTEVMHSLKEGNSVDGISKVVGVKRKGRHDDEEEEEEGSIFDLNSP